MFYQNGRWWYPVEGDVSKTGKRVQIYIPADVLESFNHIPRYERSSLIADLLRAHFNIDKPQNKPQAADHKKKESGDTAL